MENSIVGAGPLLVLNIKRWNFLKKLSFITDLTWCSLPYQDFIFYIVLYLPAGPTLTVNVTEETTIYCFARNTMHPTYGNAVEMIARAKHVIQIRGKAKLLF